MFLYNIYFIAHQDKTLQKETLTFKQTYNRWPYWNLRSLPGNLEWIKIAWTQCGVALGANFKSKDYNYVLKTNL